MLDRAPFSDYDNVTGDVAAPHGDTQARPAGTSNVAAARVRPVFDRLVAALSAEAERRSLPVVTHTGPATYRVRAYLATLVEKKKKQATLSWVWEVFDSSQNRAFRVAGREALGAARNDVWAQCDDAMLMRIAAKGFDELVARLGPLPTPDAPLASGPAIAFTAPDR